MDLTEKVLAYQRGELGWYPLHQIFYAETQRFVLSLGYGEEDAHEFFYFTLERLKTIARQFIFSGFKFKTYLSRCIEWQWKSYQRKIWQDQKRELEACIASSRMSQTCDMGTAFSYDEVASTNDDPCLVCSDPPIGPAPETSDLIRDIRSLKTNDRHLLVIALRNCLAMEDELCILLARHLGASASWIMALVDQLRQSLSASLEQKTYLRDRYLAHIHASPGTSRPLTRRVLAPKIHPYHKDIAAVLGIPKGTIDSIMWSSRERMKKAQLLGKK